MMGTLEDFKADYPEEQPCSLVNIQTRIISTCNNFKVVYHENLNIYIICTRINTEFILSNSERPRSINMFISLTSLPLL